MVSEASSTVQSNISDYLKALPRETLYFRPNRGNAGDSLLAHATFQLFKSHQIRYRLPQWHLFNPQGKTIVFGGGGNLVPYYTQARDFIRRYHRAAKRFIVLPSTISQHRELLREFGPNVDIICRETVSYEHVRKHALKAGVMLMHDLAFSLNPQDTLTQKPPLSRHLLCRALSLSWTQQELGYLARRVLGQLPGPASDSVLSCFRTDAEQGETLVPTENWDIAREFAYGTDNRTVSAYVSHALLNVLNRYDEIHTNRIHICIAGALLGKPVALYPNAYYKCRAIFEHSIAGRYPNVRWMGSEENAG